MLGTSLLQTYLCERADGVGCCVCPDRIKNREIYFLLFQDDPSHAPVPIHRSCARAALETFILKREQRNSAQRRLELRIDKLPNGCWSFKGSKDDRGYGLITYEGKTVRAHRLSYILFVGDIPEDSPNILHTCDFTSCVNPEHLYAGTQERNIQDREERGRTFKKLTDEQVASIFSDSRPQIEIAAEYGIHINTVSGIKTGIARVRGNR